MSTGEYIDLVCPFCGTSLTGVYWAWSDMRRGHCPEHDDIEAIVRRRGVA